MIPNLHVCSKASKAMELLRDQCALHGGKANLTTLERKVDGATTDKYVIIASQGVVKGIEGLRFSRVYWHVYDEEITPELYARVNARIFVE